MKVPAPFVEIKYWRPEQLFNIGFASYSLEHHSFPRHFHEHYVIELVIQGADKFYCDGRTHTASANELVFINPGEVHTGSTVSEKPLHYYSMSPTKKELQHIASILEKPLPDDFCFGHSLHDQRLLAHKMLLLFNTFQCSGAESLPCEELFLDLMNDVLDNVCGNNHIAESRKDIRIRQLIDFMRASLSEALSLQQMAEVIRVSPFHLIRLFKAATGLSPYEYLLVLRTEHAKRLLQNGYSVQDAAWASGFYDTSHFNRMFKKVSGATPKIFRSSK